MHYGEMTSTDSTIAPTGGQPGVCADHKGYMQKLYSH